MARNDDEYCDSMRIGHLCASDTARLLAEMLGLPHVTEGCENPLALDDCVYVPQFARARNKEEIQDFTRKEKDIILVLNHMRKELEHKSRAKYGGGWRKIEDYPFYYVRVGDKIIRCISMDTVHGWANKNNKPHYGLLIRPTDKFIAKRDENDKPIYGFRMMQNQRDFWWIPPYTSHQWLRVKTFFGNDGYEQEMWVCPMELAQPADKLVSTINAIRNGKDMSLVMQYANRPTDTTLYKANTRLDKLDETG